MRLNKTKTRHQVSPALKNSNTIARASSVTVSTEEDALRLDSLLRKTFRYLSYATIQKLCRRGKIRLDNQRAKASQRVSSGQTITLLTDLLPSKQKATEVEDFATNRQKLLSWIVYQDSCLLVLNKPSGIPVQAGTGHQLSVDRLVNAVFPEDHCKLVHRLDIGTSGLLLFAKGRKNAAWLAEAFAQREVKKHYLALVQGIPEAAQGTITSVIANPEQASIPQEAETELAKTANIESAEKQQTNAYPIKDKKEPKQRVAVTEYQVIGSYKNLFSLLLLAPKTGFKHQLRIHCAENLKTPIVGDGTEFPDFTKFKLARRMHLHAKSLTLTKPRDKKSNFHFVAKLPEDLRQTWAYLGFKKLD